MSLEIPFPAPPSHSFKPLSSQAFPVGARVLHYIQNKVKVPIPPDFKDNCDALDAIREQLRTTGELPIDRAEQVSDYIHLLTTISCGFDISEQGAGLQFTWNGVTLYNLDFEISSLCYNLCVGLLTSCTRLEPTRAPLKQLVAAIRAAKSLADKAQEHHQEDFGGALPTQTLIDVQTYITAVYYQAQLGVMISANKVNFYAKAAMLASSSFSRAKPPQDNYALYYSIVAMMFYGEQLYNAQEYGKAVSYARQVFKAIPTDKKVLKKLPEPFQSLYPSLLQTFKVAGDKWEHENAKIYFEAVPKEPEEIPALKPTPITGSINWEQFITPVTRFEATISDSFEDKINDRLTNFKTEASRALQDIGDSLALLPKNVCQEAEQKHEQLIKTRTEASNLSQQISTIMGIKANSISSKCPQLFQQYNNMRNALQKASETDIYYETQLAKSESLGDGLNLKGNKLEDLRGQIGQILRLADIAAEEARNSKGAGMTATIQAMQTMSSTFDELAKQLNPLFGETIKTVKEVKAEAEKTSQQFRTDMASACNGFDQAILCYTKLCNNFNAILNTANQC